MIKHHANTKHEHVNVQITPPFYTPHALHTKFEPPCGVNFFQPQS